MNIKKENILKATTLKINKKKEINFLCNSSMVFVYLNVDWYGCLVILQII